MKARLVSYVNLAPEIRHFVFEVPEKEKLDFQPGQFVSLSEMVREKKITRAYSVAAPAKGDNRFEICLNRVQDGVFTPWLFAMEPGAEIDMKGPLGMFVWRSPRADSILVATGTGIVPFRAMIADALALGAGKAITLIYGVRHCQNLIYHEEFSELACRFPQFRYVPSLTRPEESWKGATGRVQPLLLEAIGSRRDLHIYACGLREMVDSVREIGKELGFDRKQVITEKYD